MVRQSAASHEAEGRHLLLTLSGCAAPPLDDEPALRRLVIAAAEATGATVLSVVSHRFSPVGVTVLALLAESHAGLHTYPEQEMAFWDCFTCGEHCDPCRSIAVLSETLRPSHLAEDLIVRGAGRARRLY